MAIQITISEPDIDGGRWVVAKQEDERDGTFQGLYWEYQLQYTSEVIERVAAWLGRWEQDQGRRK